MREGVWDHNVGFARGELLSECLYHSVDDSDHGLEGLGGLAH